MCLSCPDRLMTRSSSETKKLQNNKLIDPCRGQEKTMNIKELSANKKETNKLTKNEMSKKRLVEKKTEI